MATLGLDMRIERVGQMRAAANFGQILANRIFIQLGLIHASCVFGRKE